MLLLPILLFVCGHAAVESQSITMPTPTVSLTASFSTSTSDTPSLLLRASPDYPVLEGQPVNLQCNPTPASLQHLENQKWETVSNSGSMTLTEAKDSGLYRCTTWSKWSQNYTVLIIATQPTVGEKLGTAAFVCSLLTFAITVAILFWLCWQKFNVILPISSTVTAFPGPNTAPQKSSQQIDEDQDVYINYTNSNPAYTDLDPTKMAVASIYSTLS